MGNIRVVGGDGGMGGGGADGRRVAVAGHKRLWGRHLGEIRMAKVCMVGAQSGHHRSAEDPMAPGGKREAGPAP